MIDLEDDGASFRVRRQIQLAQMYGQAGGMVIDSYGRPFGKPPVPAMVKGVCWTLAASFWVFLIILAACAIDFVLWSFGLPV